MPSGKWNGIQVSFGDTLSPTLAVVISERQDLFYRLSYPEKLWKIVNFYYNSGKAWIPEKNQEKLDRLLEQEAARKKFLKLLQR